VNHLDLFSGIGGFALAASWVWPDHKVVAFCDNEAFAAKVLNKHWPDVPVIDDIRKIRQQRPLKKHVGYDYGTVDLITGGFPCQPFSCAGKRGGTGDDRYLWPEMLRVIREIRPTWVLGENVAGIINVALDQVCTDLEDAGYAVQPFIIPACAVGACHRRDRIWIIGHSTISRKPKKAGKVRPSNRQVLPENGEQLRDVLDTASCHANNALRIRHRQNHEISARRDSSISTNRHAPDTQRISGRPGLRQNGQEQDRDQSANGYGNAPDTIGQYDDHGRHGAGQILRERREAPEIQRCRDAWDEPWLEAATRLCSVDDGLPGGLVRPRGWRVNALKAAGNAICPQVAAAIMEAIKETS